MVAPAAAAAAAVDVDVADVVGEVVAGVDDACGGMEAKVVLGLTVGLIVGFGSILMSVIISVVVRARFMLGRSCSAIFMTWDDVLF